MNVPYICYFFGAQGGNAPPLILTVIISLLYLAAFCALGLWADLSGCESLW